MDKYRSTNLVGVLVTSAATIGAIVLFALGKDAGAVAMLTFAAGHGTGVVLGATGGDAQQ